MRESVQLNPHFDYISFGDQYRVRPERLLQYLEPFLIHDLKPHDPDRSGSEKERKQTDIFGPNTNHHMLPIRMHTPHGLTLEQKTDFGSSLKQQTFARLEEIKPRYSLLMSNNSSIMSPTRPWAVHSKYIDIVSTRYLTTAHFTPRNSRNTLQASTWWTPQCHRGRRRPINTRKSDLEQGMWMAGFRYSSRKMEVRAQDKAGWGQVLCGLWY